MKIYLLLIVLIGAVSFRLYLFSHHRALKFYEANSLSKQRPNRIPFSCREVKQRLLTSSRPNPSHHYGIGQSHCFAEF